MINAKLIYYANYRHLGQEPYVIDSADFSPQHRLRLYWHNIPFNPYIVLLHKRQDVQDVLTKHCDRYALVKKIRTVTTRSNSLRCGTFYEYFCSEFSVCRKKFAEKFSFFF